MTLARQNCSQTQWKGLNIKRDIADIMDMFNWVLLRSEGSIGLWYPLSRYCLTNIHTVLLSILGNCIFIVIMCFGFILFGKMVINRMFLYFVYRLWWRFYDIPQYEANGSQLVKKFSAFYGPRRSITAFTIARHLSLSWACTRGSVQVWGTSLCFITWYVFKVRSC
jgi:hypothetical protein